VNALYAAYTLSLLHRMSPNRNVAIENRWTHDEGPSCNQELAADLVNRHVTIIATNVAGRAQWAND
jgi:hypothetical protein